MTDYDLLNTNSLLDNKSVLMDMRQAVFSRTPFSYRVGNSTLHVQTKFVTIVAFVGLFSLVVLFLLMPTSRLSASNLTNDIWGHGEEHEHTQHKHRNNWFTFYNSTYPLTPPIYSERGYLKYRIAVISDLDKDSKHPTESDTWISYLKQGYLTVNTDSQDVRVDWDSDLIMLKSHMSYGGRGMELSELIVFNGKLYAVDDRTGIIFEIDIHNKLAIPWVVLMDGNGRESKGFKSEWATIKDETLIIGGLGKEWTTSSGELLNHNPQWVKTITPRGFIEHHDWTKNYEKLRSSVGISFPGYMIHEACNWSEAWQRWVFLPRRASTRKYDDKEDEHKGTNVMLQATEGFEHIEVSHVGEKIDTHGFSSFKHIPGTKEELIVALKSEEVDGKVATYIMVFNKSGNVIIPEQKIGEYKFEGIEFV